MSEKPTKPSKPATTRKPRGPARALKLTDDQLAACQRIAEKNAAFGATPPVLAVAAAALVKGLEALDQ